MTTSGNPTITSADASSPIHSAHPDRRVFDSTISCVLAVVTLRDDVPVAVAESSDDIVRLEVMEVHQDETAEIVADAEMMRILARSNEDFRLGRDVPGDDVRGL